MNMRTKYILFISANFMVIFGILFYFYFKENGFWLSRIPIIIAYILFILGVISK
jgi:4-amino-4-deoxy-L-arabinose transferase-like glycosyltransferase